MCSVCEDKTCDDTHLATLKCREWRDRRAGFYCGYQQCKKELKVELDFMERACEGATEMYRDLMSARELLKLFVQWHYDCCKEPDYKNLVKQAEQFLNREEESNDTGKE